MAVEVAAAEEEGAGEAAVLAAVVAVDMEAETAALAVGALEEWALALLALHPMAPPPPWDLLLVWAEDGAVART